MLHITIVDLSDYLLLTVIGSGKKKLSGVDLQKLSIRKITMPYTETFPKTLGSAISGAKGLVIADSTRVPWVVGFIASECRNRTPWLAAQDKGLAVVFNSLSPTKVVSETFAAPLVCLKCLEEDKETVLRADALYPYCTGHREASLHRR